MSRVKRGNIARKRRKKVLKLTKGFSGSLSKLFRPAQQALLHALNNAYRDRRRKKRDFRGLWIARINAALDQKGISYSKFFGTLNKKDIQLNRKVLSELAIHHPDCFSAVVESAQSNNDRSAVKASHQVVPNTKLEEKKVGKRDTKKEKEKEEVTT